MRAAEWLRKIENLSYLTIMIGFTGALILCLSLYTGLSLTISSLRASDTSDIDGPRPDYGIQRQRLDHWFRTGRHQHTFPEVPWNRPGPVSGISIPE